MSRFRLLAAAWVIVVGTLVLGSCGGDDPVAPPGKGSITIDGDPDGIRATWVLEGPDSFMLTGQGDTLLTDMALGDYDITWQPVAEWLLPVPATQTRTVRANVTITFQGLYVWDDPDRAVLIINPEPDGVNTYWLRARAGVSGGFVGSGDDTLSGQIPGTYTITWGGVVGWVTPEPTVLAAASPETTVFTGTYQVDWEAYPVIHTSWIYGDAPLPEGFPMIITGNAVDREDGWLPPEALTWTSDLDGILVPDQGRFNAGLLSVGVHQIRLRAEDNHGLVSADTFTLNIVAEPAQTPTVTVTVPDWGDYLESQGAPSPPVLGWDGTDPAAGDGHPAYVRFLFLAARLPDGETYARTRTEVEANLDFLAPMDHEYWSSWLPYAEVEAERRITFPDLARTDGQGRLIHYLFVIQAWSETGAISTALTYAVNMANFYILPPK